MKMNPARYTAGTEFYVATGDIQATQQLLQHEDIGATANIYVQPNEASLERKLAEIYEAGDRRMIPPAPAESQSFLSPNRD
jgi:site-specific recombinase XerC